MLTAAGGCRGGPTIAQGLQSSDPGERIAATIRAAERRDMSVLPLLVQRLEDPESDVRFYAILALQRLTGETLGYRFYDSAEKRSQAARRWQEWLQRRAGAKKG